jgi:Domain of unknown function (DUF4388)
VLTVLRGSSDSLALSALLELLADQHKTGRLDVRSGRSTATIYLDGGRIRELRGRDGGRGFVIGSGDHLGAWPEDMMDLLAGLLTDRSLTFVFDPRSGPRSGCACDIDTGCLVAAAEARGRRWSEIRRTVDRLDSRPKLVPRADQIGWLAAADWCVLTRINAVHTVSALARQTGMGRLETCEVLAHLVDLGLVELETNMAAPVDEGHQPASADPVEYVRVLRADPHHGTAA